MHSPVLSLSLLLSQLVDASSVLWNAAAAATAVVATRRKRFDSIAGAAGRPSTGKFSRAEEGKTRPRRAGTLLGNSQGKEAESVKENEPEGTEGRGGKTAMHSIGSSSSSKIKW